MKNITALILLGSFATTANLFAVSTQHRNELGNAVEYAKPTSSGSTSEAVDARPPMPAPINIPPSTATPEEELGDQAAADEPKGDKLASSTSGLNKLKDSRKIVRTEMLAASNGREADVVPLGNGEYQFTIDGRTTKVQEVDAETTRQLVAQAKSMDPNNKLTFTRALGDEGADDIKAFRLNKGLTSFLGVLPERFSYYFPATKAVQDAMLAGADALIENVLMKFNPVTKKWIAWSGGGGGGGMEAPQ